MIMMSERINDRADISPLGYIILLAVMFILAWVMAG